MSGDWSRWLGERLSPGSGGLQGVVGGNFEGEGLPELRTFGEVLGSGGDTRRVLPPAGSAGPGRVRSGLEFPDS